MGVGLGLWQSGNPGYETMAFAPASGDHKCYQCRQGFKWFQMMESDNPATHEGEDLGHIPEGEKKEGANSARTKRHRVCPACELEYRKRVVEEHPIRKEDPEWATLPRVRKDMKNEQGRAEVEQGRPL